ncbi:MAG: AAA family ATPase [Gammaproteobacteria bacterium]
MLSRTTNGRDGLLADWQTRALVLENEVKRAIVGQERAIRLLNIAVFARGHVLLEGDVGVGKTTLLRAVARAIGGDFERIEGTIDLMPNDLVYYTYINEEGRPRVDLGPLLKHGDTLSVFFFNEVNRARPQVHSLLLRVMAERGVSAFNREYRFPHLQVFADRNRIEKEETFELPSAARDRFLMEILIQAPADQSLLKDLMFEPRFHDADTLIEGVSPGVVPYREISDVASAIQDEIQTSETLREYTLALCRATRDPAAFGIVLDDVQIDQLIQAGASPRGMSMLLRAARVAAWLGGRGSVVPEDIHDVFFETIAHRVFFSPVYELRRAQIAPQLMEAIRNNVSY